MSLTHLEAPHGDNPDFLVDLTDENGAAYDPDDATQIWWTVKARKTDADSAAIFQKTKGGGLATVTVDARKKLLLTWSAAEAAGLEANRSYYTDVRILQPTGRVSTPIIGLLTATPTHATLSYS